MSPGLMASTLEYVLRQGHTLDPISVAESWQVTPEEVAMVFDRLVTEGKAEIVADVTISTAFRNDPIKVFNGYRINSQYLMST